MNVLIRQGNSADIPSVLELIKELARYEKAPQEVEVTVAEMLDSMNENRFHFFVAVKQNNVIGLALFYYKYSTWKGKCIFLEDIIVTEKNRKEGIGKLLFQEVVKVAKKDKVKRLEWQVLNWNEPAITFYKKLKTNFDEEWINCKLTFDEIQSFGE